MKGYDVVRSDGQRIGRVADAIGGFVVVELGRLVHTRLALPREFAHTTDNDRRVAVTAPFALLQGSARQPPRGVRRGRRGAPLRRRLKGVDQ